MKITTKTIYAIRAVHALNSLGAGSDNPVPVGVVRLADRLGVSNKYLEQIFTILKKNKIVKSVAGKNGGYTLIKKAEDITVLEIIILMDGNLIPIHCENNKSCERCSECSVNWLWNSLKENCENFLGNISIARLNDERFEIKGCE